MLWQKPTLTAAFFPPVPCRLRVVSIQRLCFSAARCLLPADMAPTAFLPAPNCMIRPLANGLPPEPMSTNRYWHTATALPDGTVLVAGGYGNQTYNVHSSAELYDPVTELWSSTASMSTNRYHHTATLLPDGKVLVAGGFIQGTNGGSYRQTSFSSAELYDPVAKTWTTTGSMPGGKDSHTASRLPNGKVLVVGGENNGSSGAFATIYMILHRAFGQQRPICPTTPDLFILNTSS